MKTKSKESAKFFISSMIEKGKYYKSVKDEMKSKKIPWQKNAEEKLGFHRKTLDECIRITVNKHLFENLSDSDFENFDLESKTGLLNFINTKANKPKRKKKYFEKEAVIYFLNMKNKTNIFKIGKSKMKSHRIKTLNKSYEFNLKKSFIIKTTEYNLQRLEKTFQTIYSDLNIDMGEKKDGYSEFFNLGKEFSIHDIESITPFMSGLIETIEAVEL